MALTVITAVWFSAALTLAELLNVGAVFAFTVTLMSCVALRLPSLAVTVIVAVPAASGEMVTVELETLTVAFAVSLDDTV